MTASNEKNLGEVKALISGGASGLGLATAQAIVAGGGQVVLLDIDQQQGEAAVKLLGARAMFIATDVTDEQQVDDAVAKTASHCGGLNLAVNCAGIAPSQRVLGRNGLMETAAFARAIAVNLTGVFSVCRAVANVMQHNPPQADNERGVIINTASIAAYDGQIGQAAYAASKGGVASMTLPLAREFARIGVRVVTIAPGLFDTPMFAKLPAKAVAELANAIPFPKRLGRPQEFAALVCHIYSNTMLNGEVIRLDGGLRM